MKLTKILTEEEQKDIDKEFEDYINNCPTVGHSDPNLHVTLLSKEEFDAWD